MSSRPSHPLRIAGAIAMAIGAIVYLSDRGPQSWHLFLWPALVLMAFGVLLVALGTVVRGED
jgi:uncharacterized protein YjeT (DUF2065 family)